MEDDQDDEGGMSEESGHLHPSAALKEFERVCKSLKESERIILISPTDQPQPDWAKKIQQIKFAESSPRDQIWCPIRQKPSLDKHFVTI